MSHAEQKPARSQSRVPNSNDLAAHSSGSWAASRLKRAIDLSLALPLLVVLSPVILVLCFCVRLSSPGPALFVQPRVGRNERSFLCPKLRTMRVGTPSVATHEAPRNAVTSLGRLLRATKLDELPQLWCVVKGEMSLVGPRPCLFNQAELLQERRARGVFRLRPGITGLAQVRGIDMANPKLCAEQDAEYALYASLRLDLSLLFRTFLPRRWFKRQRT